MDSADAGHLQKVNVEQEEKKAQNRTRSFPRNFAQNMLTSRTADICADSACATLDGPSASPACKEIIPVLAKNEKNKKSPAQAKDFPSATTISSWPPHTTRSLSYCSEAPEAQVPDFSLETMKSYYTQS